MKVEEAKQKVCPFSIHPIVTFVNIETGQYNSGHSVMKCICGDCMAWVWTKSIRKEDGSFEHAEGYCARIGQ